MTTKLEEDVDKEKFKKMMGLIEKLVSENNQFTSGDWMSVFFTFISMQFKIYGRTYDEFYETMIEIVKASKRQYDK